MNTLKIRDLATTDMVHEFYVKCTDEIAGLLGDNSHDPSIDYIFWAGELSDSQAHAWLDRFAPYLLTDSCESRPRSLQQRCADFVRDIQVMLDSGHTM